MSISPWDMLLYYQTPVQTVFATGATSVKALTADPMRVLIIWSAPATGSISVALKGGLPFGQGITGGGTNGQIIMNLAWWGPLVAQEWWAASSPAGNSTVTTVSMIRWPDSTVIERGTPDAIAAAIKRVGRPYRWRFPPKQR